MPSLNPEKCLTQRIKMTEPSTLPNDWLKDFCARLAEQLALDQVTQYVDSNYKTNQSTQLTEEVLYKALDKHVGKDSRYDLKAEFLQLFATLYTLFTHADILNEKKNSIASRIAEDVNAWSPAFYDDVNAWSPTFYDRVKYSINYLNIPQNKDELIAQIRLDIGDKIADQIAERDTPVVHVHNRVIKLARKTDFEVFGFLSGKEITDKTRMGYHHYFQLFGLVNAMREKLETLHATHELEKVYTRGAYERFEECVNRFISIKREELFIINNGIITDIHWQNIKHRLLQELRNEKYVRLSAEEGALLGCLLQNEPMSLDANTLNTLNTLIPHGYELAQFLEFFSEWHIQKKADFVLAHLQNKSPNEQKELLTILKNEVPQLTAQLRTQTSLLTLYFDIAIAENDIAAVKTYIDEGADINAALQLFEPEHKVATLYWLHGHPEHLEKLTASSLNSVISDGKYKDMTIAATLVRTKKGRQLLLENVPLQGSFFYSTSGDTLSAHLKQARTEKRSNRTGFFKNSQTIELVQAVVYGNLTKSEDILKAHPNLRNTLLTEKITVTDYSRRKVKQKTAFQAALCAWDNEMCEMLAKYMSKEDMVSQYQELFPQGHNRHYSDQTSFDFYPILNAISQGGAEEVEKALNLELPNHTNLWRELEQFREKFTERSCQEAVFNPEHFIQAFQLYHFRYDDWSQNQRDLFWRQVIGYTQRFLPANIAMDFAQGLYFRVEKKEKALRSFKFKRSHDDSIYPLSFGSFSGLGFQWFGDAALQLNGCKQTTLDRYFVRLVKINHRKELCIQSQRNHLHV